MKLKKDFLNENEKNNFDITYMNQITNYPKNKKESYIQNFNSLDEIDIMPFIKVNNELLKLKENIQNNKK